MSTATKDITIKKAALAYSGGLDTSVLIPWQMRTAQRVSA